MCTLTSCGVRRKLVLPKDQQQQMQQEQQQEDQQNGQPQDQQSQQAPADQTQPDTTPSKPDLMAPHEPQPQDLPKP